ncbi:hypothetical protein F4801DRAFT_68700 [Xylaria longipes]|nr:hypothetical protein F4801DRAFT_68700 [Xylaria longipes]
MLRFLLPRLFQPSLIPITTTILVLSQPKPKPTLRTTSLRCRIYFSVFHSRRIRGLRPSFSIALVQTDDSRTPSATSKTPRPSPRDRTYARSFETGHRSRGDDDPPSGPPTTLPYYCICTHPHRRAHETLVVYVSARQDRCV